MSATPEKYVLMQCGNILAGSQLSVINPASSSASSVQASAATGSSTAQTPALSIKIMSAKNQAYLQTLTA